MDNKQKKKIYKLAYVTLFIFALVITAISIYFSIQSIVKNSDYMYIQYSIIVFFVLVNLCFILDFYKTDKLQNKYNLAKLIYAVLTLTVICVFALYITFYIKNLTISSLTSLCIALLIACEFILLISFIIGLKLSKLHSNTTITIDSASETPNYDDELILKKRLNELNRKLEMKKVQEQIEKIEKELDN